MAEQTDRFRRTETWIFDLDNTLYPSSADLFGQIDQRMTTFIMRELGLERAAADALRERYWQSHGVTLGGLVQHHGVDPHHFLDEVHAIDLSALRHDPALRVAIASLRGRRIVHTNGSRRHAAGVLAALGLTDAFDAVFALEDKNLVPKPRAEAHDHVIAAAGIDPCRAVMIEDDQRNLAVPKSRGMATVWLAHDPAERAAPHVDRRIGDLAGFLSEFP